jgi:hypothetical protein
METVIMFEGDEPREVNRADVNAAMERGLEPAAEFNTPDNQRTIVRQRDFDAAFSKGLKPANAQEMGVWDAFKAGAKRGWDVFASTETGMEPEKTSLEQSQAWAESPVSYGAGVVAGMAPAALAGAGLGYGAIKGMQKTAPYVRPSVIAAKEEFKAGVKSPPIDFPLAGTASGIVGGTRAAIKQIPETQREMANLAKLERRDVNREAGSVGSQGQRIYLGQELLEPGATPEKAAIAERAATIAPSNLRADMLSKALEMGTTRRQQARSFSPELAAEDVAPSLKRALGDLKRGKGAAYSKLYEQAASEFEPETAAAVPVRLSQRIKDLKGIKEPEEFEGGGEDAPKAPPPSPVKGITGATVSALEAAHQIVEEGPSPFGLAPGAFAEADRAEQYKRLKTAREFLNSQITQMKTTKDPNISNRASLAQLVEAKEELDGVMKSIPSQAKADEMYSQASKAKEAFFDAMEFGKGMKKTIDVPTVKKLFGNNDKAYRLREGIDTMRQFLAKYGDEIMPEKRAEMEGVVNKFDALRKQAEDKRLLEGLRQAEGPSSPAIERTSALREAKGLPSNIFTSPASALNAADEFMAARSRQFFGKPFEQLGQNDKNRMIRLLMWRQQNPNATMTDEESMFKKIGKGK